MGAGTERLVGDDLADQPSEGTLRRVAGGAWRSAGRLLARHAGTIAVVVGTLWLAALLFMVWPAWRYPVFVSNSSIDSAFFAYAGELIRQGGTPYLTFWDHKPPLVYLIDAAALSLSGGAVWGLWLASLTALIGSLLLAHAAMRRPFGALGAALGITVFAFSLPQLLASNLTEEYALPLQWGSALLLARWSVTGFQQRDQGARQLRFGAVLGVLGGLAFALKANLIGAMVSVALVVTIVLLWERRLADWARFVAGGILGAAAVWGAVFAYVASQGAITPFLDQVFHYNFVYAGTSWGQRIRAMVAGITVATKFSSFVIPFAAWALAATLLVRDATHGRRAHAAFVVRCFAIVWLPVEVMFSSISGRNYVHYFVALLPPLAFLAAMFGNALVRRVEDAADHEAESGDGARTNSRRPLGALMVVAIAMAVALLSIANTGLELRDANAATIALRRTQVDESAAYVRANTPADARLLVWGHASDVYLFSGRRPASRYLYSLPLLTPGYADAALIAEFMREIQRSAPALIVDATHGQPIHERLVPGLNSWAPDWRYPTDLGPGVRWWSMTPELRQFYDYVGANYVIADTIGPQRWLMYRRLSQ